MRAWHVARNFFKNFHRHISSRGRWRIKLTASHPFPFLTPRISLSSFRTPPFVFFLFLVRGICSLRVLVALFAFFSRCFTTPSEGLWCGLCWCLDLFLRFDRLRGAGDYAFISEWEDESWKKTDRGQWGVNPGSLVERHEKEEKKKKISLSWRYIDVAFNQNYTRNKEQG